MKYLAFAEGYEVGEIAEGESLAEVLFGAVNYAARTGNRVVIDPSNGGASVYRVEPDTKVDENDLTFPVIVHTDSLMVGENA